MILTCIKWIKEQSSIFLLRKARFHHSQKMKCSIWNHIFVVHFTVKGKTKNNIQYTTVNTEKHNCAHVGLRIQPSGEVWPEDLTNITNTCLLWLSIGENPPLLPNPPLDWPQLNSSAGPSPVSCRRGKQAWGWQSLMHSLQAEKKILLEFRNGK